MNNNYTIMCYTIWFEPINPQSNGTYYGKTPILEQAQGVVKALRKEGQGAFLKAICSDGMERYVDF